MTTTAATTRPRSKRRQRRGFLTLELVMTLPCLLAVLVAVVMFSQLLMSEQAVHAAASVAAREASLPGATRERIYRVVRHALDGWRFGDSERIRIVVEVNGHPANEEILARAPTGSIVSVMVVIPASEAVPDMLSTFGVSLEEQWINGKYVMRRE